ncbi:MAG: tyrosine-type recombinase/integrase [Parabacteroides sp.]|nr:tyrosine-type recombinase/integrase [Parabacteroides sp.]
MKRVTDFAGYLTDFLGRYLPLEYGASVNTIATYSQTFILFLRYMQKVELIRAESVCLKDITRDSIVGFLKWLEKERECGASTRNARLGALHSFFKYLQYRDVEGLARWQDVMTIQYKRNINREMAYLTIEGIRLLLRQPFLATRAGRRDFALLGLLYDSGARVQELIDLTPSSLRFGETTTIRLLGKGNKVRVVPLSENQVKNLRQYMTENVLFEPLESGHPLFCNPQKSRLTRMSVLNIVKKYALMARQENPFLIPEKIGCHSLRHSKAMHLLEADINLVYIRDFLGHSSTTTTEIYARASEKKKQEALEKLNPGIVRKGKTCWQKDRELMGYLKSIKQKY